MATLYSDTTGQMVGKSDYDPSNPSANVQSTSGVDPNADWTATQTKKKAAVAGGYEQANAGMDIYKSMLGRQRQIGSDYDAATQVGIQNMRRGNAQALQAQSAAAGAGNTGMFGNMLQSAMNYGQQSSGFLAGQNQAKQQAMTGAQDAANAAKMQALGLGQAAKEYDIKAGTEGADIAASNAAAEADVQNVISDNTKWWGLDREAIANALTQKAAETTDPHKKQVYMQHSQAIVNGSKS